MQYKKYKPFNSTQIDAKTLFMDLTSILNLIPSLKDEKKWEVQKLLSTKEVKKVKHA